MERLSIEEKNQVARDLSQSGHPIHNLAKRKKSNSSPTYDSASLRSRSKRTAKKRAEKIDRVARKLASPE